MGHVGQKLGLIPGCQLQLQCLVLQHLVGPFHLNILFPGQTHLLLQQSCFQSKLFIGRCQFLLLLLKQLLRFTQGLRLILQLLVGHPQLIRLGKQLLGLGLQFLGENLRRTEQLLHTDASHNAVEHSSHILRNLLQQSHMPRRKRMNGADLQYSQHIALVGKGDDQYLAQSQLAGGKLDPDGLGRALLQPDPTVIRGALAHKALPHMVHTADLAGLDGIAACQCIHTGFELFRVGDVEAAVHAFHQRRDLAHKTLPDLLQIGPPLKNQHDAVQLCFEPGFLFILLVEILLTRPLLGQIPEQPVKQTDNLADFILAAVVKEFHRS
ncbi:hypothetical protein D3C75_694480 [compost metagenome]